MSANSWSEENPYDEIESVSALLSDLAEAATVEDRPTYPGFAGRRRKAAVVLSVIWGGTIALHLISWGYWLVLGLTTLMSVHALRVIFARPLPIPSPLRLQDMTEAGVAGGGTLPYVSLLVAAKNEEAVIGNLVETLCNLDYPACHYDLWVIDDNSTDQTPKVLEQLQDQYEQLHVIRRSPGATGGKSGALNQVWHLTKADVLAVFDADAQVSRDLLQHVLPLFERERVGAVQVRKAIANVLTNFWTRGQAAEMALDSYFQQQRIAIGGLGELRGNGQFVRRKALEDCGGWNEETITDDLDLTLQLHLNQWDIDFLSTPAVQEEGVTTAVALWHQRNRWAEGGYQRYLDYWRLISQNRMGFSKSLDLALFWITQYFLPSAAVPDLLMAIARNRPLIYTPITSLTLTLSLMGMFLGLRRIQTQRANRVEAVNPQRPRLLSSSTLFITLLQTLRGTFYMLHWFPVIASAAIRMSIRPKRLKWVKTIHQGTHLDQDQQAA